ncbi:MAG: class I SAM-dependent methyltransferase [Gammaproteobacteria bacterium]|nr:class I SAM-dependent methyltransferase [Gammaproteobacteria bacterium]
MNSVIEQIYATRQVVGKSGRVQELHSAIDKEEGEFLYRILSNDPTLVKTLEVGCACGLSSLYICEATRGRSGAHHTIIDPHQNSGYDGVGIRNLQQAGVGHAQLIEERSEFVLPRLLEGGSGPYDFIFLDGWHTFDHTLLDSFYATRLLRVGGVLALDDADWESVGRVVDFLLSYPCYEELGRVTRVRARGWKGWLAPKLASPLSTRRWKALLSRNAYRKIFEQRITRMIALRKRSEDARSWTWHSEAL